LLDVIDLTNVGKGKDAVAFLADSRLAFEL